MNKDLYKIDLTFHIMLSKSEWRMKNCNVDLGNLERLMIMMMMVVNCSFVNLSTLKVVTHEGSSRLTGQKLLTKVIFFVVRKLYLQQKRFFILKICYYQSFLTVAIYIYFLNY